MGLRNAFAHRNTNLVTSDFVLIEFLTWASRPPFRALAIQAVERIHASMLMMVVPCTTELWQRGYSMFKERKDKEWSPTDCTSIEICRVHGIHRVLTADHHFVQAGLEALLR